jgi:hypothetical protein
MKPRVEYENRGDYLLVSVFGEVTLESGEALVEDIWRETKRQRLDRVLLFAWEMLPNTREFSKFILGIRMGQVWGDSIKVAEVGRSALNEKCLEYAAVISGGRFKVFTDEKLALQWLMGDA